MDHCKVNSAQQLNMNKWKFDASQETFHVHITFQK